MFKKKPILQYESTVEIYPNIITPAKMHVPEWYKKIPKWENNTVFSVVDNEFNSTVKQCIPFLESLTTGYMITLAFDIYVTKINDAPCITWKVKHNYVPESRSNPADKNIIPTGHYPIEFTWRPPVSITIPKGYSYFFTHPINRNDLPFTTISGFIDGGFVAKAGGNFPFYVKKDFEGIIPQGTPIAQIIPFYKQNWSSKIQNGLILEGEKTSRQSRSLISGWYKKTFWTRKKYD